MAEPKKKTAVVANIHHRLMHFEKAGDVCVGHKHEFAHITFLAHGSLRVTINGKQSVFYAPQLIYIPENVEHGMEALEDNTVASCINGIRDGDGVADLIDPSSIPDGVNILSLAKTY